MSVVGHSEIDTERVWFARLARKPHITRMTWEKGHKLFECSGCGAKWRASYFNVPVREKGSFDCTDCGTQVLRWNGSTDYDDWERIQDD